MNLFLGQDLVLFFLLLSLFIYVFVTVTITNLHKVYFLFHFLMMLWPLCQFATDVTSNPRLQLVYVLMSFVSLSMLGAGWLLLTIFMAGNANKLRGYKALLLFLPAVIAAIGVLINPAHAFVSPVDGGYIHRTYGPWFWFVITILLGYFFVSLFFLYQALGSPKAGLTVKRQVRVTLWGIFILCGFALSDLLLNVVLSHWLPIIPGLTSIGIFLSDLFFVFAIKKYNVFDLISIANEDVVQNIPYGILVVDENDTIIEVNKALLLYADLVVGDHFEMAEWLASARVDGDRQAFVDNYNQRSNDFLQIEIIIDRETAHYLILQASPMVVSGDIQMGWTITLQDVTHIRHLLEELHQKNETLNAQNQSLANIRDELSLANNKLQQMALTDSLTHCYNRRYLIEHLTQAVSANVRQQIPYSLIIFDIDFFKEVNDRYGHVAGDEVLSATVQRVKQLLRSEDVLARFGGEEFIIYLPRADNQIAEELAERLRSSVASNPIIVEHTQMPINITISVGVLSIEDFSESGAPQSPERYLIDLFSAVDEALYQAKRNGRNQVAMGYLSLIP